MSEPTTFKITWGDEETIIEGRSNAVEFAKSKSADVPMNVNVDSVDETSSSTVSMTYNGGSLEVYVAETRSPDRRSRKRDRNEEETASEENTAEDSAPVADEVADEPVASDEE